MDTYENYSFPEPMRPEYSGKKISPFANSDYVTPFDGAPAPEKNTERPRKKHRGKTFLAFLLIAALMVSCCTVTAVIVDSYWQNEMDLFNQVVNNKLAVMQEQINRENAENNAVPPSASGLLTPSQVYARNVSAVTAISCKCTTTNIYGQTTQTESKGSGFLISQDGYLVTNYHVVEGATEVNVRTHAGVSYRAEIVGYEIQNDICLLKFDGQDLPFVTLGSSDALVVGDQVAAIGNPLGELNATLTVGYISAKDRTVTTDGTVLNMLQTDAAINSGNSGGPLFNMMGEVVGITTAKYSGTTTSGASIEGISFAIPMDDVAGMISDLREYGYITGAYLGVSILDVEQSAQMYGVPAGAYVQEVVFGSAAQRAGVKAGDIIVNLGGYDVTCVTDVSRILRKFKAGDATTITVYRSGREVNLSVTLDEKPR